VCGFSDADLFAFKNAGGRFDQMTGGVAQDTLEALPDALATRFDTAFRRVADAREQLTTTRPTLAIETLAREAGLVAGAVHPDDPAAASLRGGQMLRGLTYVRHLAGQGLEWSEITEELQRVVDGDETVDSMTLETGRGAAVRLMNVHQAKGLEAPVVFLADPYSRGGGSHSPNLHVRREEGEVAVPVAQGESHYQTLTHAPLAWHEEGSEGPGFQSEEARHQEAEARRLLYVAATRAENMLVVSTYEDKPGGGYWGALHDALGRADVPALPSPPERDEAPTRSPAPALGRITEQRDRRVRALSQPSYEVGTVTAAKAAGQNGRQPADGPFASEGYGKAFGTAVHALFELLIRERATSLEGVPVQALLERHTETPAEEAVQRARRMGEGLLESNLWREVRAARRVYAEYPIATSTLQTGDADGPPLTVQRGTIDLLYQTPEGDWHLVDFKTDQLADGASASLDATPLDAAHPYCRQVRAYGSAWAGASGAASAQQGLWLADADAYVAVPDEGASNEASHAADTPSLS